MIEIFDTNQFIGGWFVGPFEPTAFATSNCEVCYKIHHQGETWPTHYHKLSDEINYLIEGKMSINGIELTAPVVFVIPKGEISVPIFHTEVKLIVVKVPGVLNDKYVVDD